MASELIIASVALKRALGMRMTFQEMGFQAPAAVPLLLDALGTIRGVEMDRISGESRHMAAGLGMIRIAVEDHAVELYKVPGTHNIADIFTKPLIGDTLRKARARVLGLEMPAKQPIRFALDDSKAAAGAKGKHPPQRGR